MDGYMEKLLVRVAVCLAVALPVIAQDAITPQEPVDNLKLSVQVVGEYDDNRDGVSSGEEENYNAILKSYIGYRIEVDRSFLDLYYSPSFLWRSNPRDETEPAPQNDTDIYHELGLVGEHALTPRLTIGASELYSITDDPSVESGGVTVRQDASYWMNRVGGWFDWSMTPRLLLSADGAYSIKRYEEDFFAEQAGADEDKVEANGFLKFLAGADMTVFGQVGFSDAEYENVDHGVASIMTYALGAEKQFSPNLFGSVAAGYQMADRDNAAEQDADSPYGNVRVVLSPSPATDLELVAEYALINSDWDPYSSQERASFSARLSHDVTARLEVHARGLYANGNYDSDSVVEGTAAPGGDDTLMDARLGATYRLSRHLSASVGYEYEDWDSDIRESFTRNRGTVSVKAEL